MFSQFLQATPEAYRQARQVSSTEGCCFRHFRPLHRYAENIGLELHEQVIDDGAPVDAQSFHVDFTIGGHGFKNVTCLIAHGLKCGTCNIAHSRSSSQANDSTASMGIPISSTEA